MGIGLSALATVVAVVAFLALGGAGLLIRMFLESEGFKPSALRVAALSLSHAKLDDLALGPGGAIAARSIDLQYSLASLFEHRIKRVAATGLALPISIGADGVRMGPIDLAGDGSGRGGFTVDELALTDVDLTISAAGESTHLRLDGALKNNLDGPHGLFDVAATGTLLTLAGRLVLVGDSFSLSIERASLVLPPANLQQISGTLDGSVPGAPRRWLQVALRSAAAEVAAHRFRNFDISGEVGADTAGFRVAAEADGAQRLTASIDADGLRDPNPSLTAEAQLGAGKASPALDAKVSIRRVATAPETFAIGVMFASSAGPIAGGTAGPSRLTANLRETRRDGAFEMRLTEPATLMLGALAMPDRGLMLPQGATFSLKPATEPVLSMQDGASPILHATITSGALQGTAQGVPISIAASSLDLAGAWPNGAKPLDVLLTLDGFRIGPAGQRGAPAAWLAPLRVQGNAQVGDGPVTFTLHAFGADGRLAADATGKHDLESATGEARLKLAPLKFVKGALQPSDIVPAALGVVSDAEGTLALSGTVRWAGGQQRASDLSLLLDQMSFAAGPMTVAKLNGVVALTRLWPLATKPDQVIAVGAVNLGVPLTDSLLHLGVAENGGARLSLERMRLLGGTVQSSEMIARPFEGILDGVLDVSDVDLSQALDLAGLQGLTAQGKLAGHIPLHVRSDGIAIDNARLDATAPGIIRYRPDPVPAALANGGANIELLLAALKDFHYDALWLTLVRNKTGQTDVGLHLQGANPALYGGHPVLLNVNLHGELDRIITSSLQGYRVPDQIRERMLHFNEGH